MKKQKSSARNTFGGLPRKEIQNIQQMVDLAWTSGISDIQASSILSSLLRGLGLTSEDPPEFKKLQSRDAFFFRMILHLLTYFVFCKEEGIVLDNLMCLSVDEKNKNKVINRMKTVYHNMLISNDVRKKYIQILNTVYMGSRTELQCLGTTSDYMLDYTKVNLAASLSHKIKQRIGRGTFERANYGEQQTQPGMMEEHIQILHLLKLSPFIVIKPRK